MKITLINGSPKVKSSASGALIEDFKGYLGEKAEVVEVGFHTTTLTKEVIEEMSKTEAWVFVYPLYVDGIPGHLLSCLVQLEQACLQNPQIHIYGIVNCGFYEGVQAELSLKILQNWSLKAGFVWGGGVGIGGGGGLAMMPKLEPGHGPKAPIDKALQGLSETVLKKVVHENCYVSVAFPRSLYRMGAQSGWRQMIKANGGTAKDLSKIPE
ncbi:MAG: NAD(P)H-dependent oxidoreductase [Acetatifactor sp.]|nr:NAD(P)H-dependent oxidoreductase [Acetatifactor sp.]